MVIPEFRLLSCRLSNLIGNSPAHLNHLPSRVILNRREISVTICQATAMEETKQWKGKTQSLWVRRQRGSHFNHTQKSSALFQPSKSASSNRYSSCNSRIETRLISVYPKLVCGVELENVLGQILREGTEDDGID